VLRPGRRDSPKGKDHRFGDRGRNVAARDNSWYGLALGTAFGRCSLRRVFSARSPGFTGQE
jgi:hypothetical protein